jgi:hypothetical protein
MSPLSIVQALLHVKMPSSSNFTMILMGPMITIIQGRSKEPGLLQAGRSVEVSQIKTLARIVFLTTLVNKNANNFIWRRPRPSQCGKNVSEDENSYNCYVLNVSLTDRLPLAWVPFRFCTIDLFSLRLGPLVEIKGIPRPDHRCFILPLFPSRNHPDVIRR